MLLDQDLDRTSFRADGGQRCAAAPAAQGLLLGAPVRLAVELDFRRGPATPVVERATLSGRLDAQQIAILGFDATRALEGPVALEARVRETPQRPGPGGAAGRPARRLARGGGAELGKRPGTAGTAEATLRLQGEALAAVESFRVEALELSLRGWASFGRQSRLDRVEITESLFGGSRFTGLVRPPEGAGGAWSIGLRGPLFDLRPILGPPGHAEGGGVRGPAGGAPAAGDASGPPLLLDLRFDRVTMGDNRNLVGVQASARTDARGVLREARATGRTTPPGWAPRRPARAGACRRVASPARSEFALTPRGEQRHLRLLAEDGGGLLHALDLVQCDPRRPAAGQWPATPNCCSVRR